MHGRCSKHEIFHFICQTSTINFLTSVYSMKEQKNAIEGRINTLSKDSNRIESLEMDFKINHYPFCKRERERACECNWSINLKWVICKFPSHARLLHRINPDFEIQIAQHDEIHNVQDFTQIVCLRLPAQRKRNGTTHLKDETRNYQKAEYGAT